MSIKSILISQPRPKNDKSPYFDLAKKHNLKIDFIPFIQVEGIDAQEFRLQRINLEDYSAVILTSKNAVDHYFRIAKESRFTVPNSMKYFCISEAIAYYLQKYVTFRKRKIFFGKTTIDDLIPAIKKNKDENFLLPCSDILRQKIPDTLTKAKINFTPTTLYKTVASDLSHLSEVKYDILVFYSPSGIESLLKNFPEFKQEKTKIAAFGPTTAKAIEKNNLKLDIKAPTSKMPSMTMALEDFVIKSKNK